MRYQRPPVHSVAHAPPRRYLDRLDETSAAIQPDDAELFDWFERYRDQHRLRLATDLRLVEQFAKPGARILEIGASPFLLTAALAGWDIDVQAIDVAPERFATAVANLALSVATCDIERQPLDFGDGSFDLILFNELFEHLHRDPIYALRQAYRVLAADGRLLLSTPNLRSFRGIKNLLLHNQAHAVSGGVYDQWRKLELLGHMGHVREYTSREVVEFLQAIGFSVERLIFRGGHGRGPVGLAERLFPSMRPFVTVVASRARSST